MYPLSFLHMDSISRNPGPASEHRTGHTAYDVVLYNRYKKSQHRRTKHTLTSLIVNSFLTAEKMKLCHCLKRLTMRCVQTHLRCPIKVLFWSQFIGIYTYLGLGIFVESTLIHNGEPSTICTVSLVLQRTTERTYQPPSKCL